MFIYWFLFLVPVYFLLWKAHGGAYTLKLEWQLFGIFLVILIGLRHQVGGDWFAYLDGLEFKNYAKLNEFFFSPDPGFTLVSWFSIALGASIYGTNLICAAIFTGGLISLCRAQPYPWLGILVAVPYLVIVVGMGYTRQAAAIGFLMYGFVYIVRGRVAQYLMFVLFAGIFHKTAFIFFAIALFKPGSGKLQRFLGISLFITLVGGIYLLEKVEILYMNYVEQSMNSTGGEIRVLMNLPPAIILLFFWKKWGESFKGRWFWGIISALAIICVPLVIVSSTAVDRMALYLIPLQIVVWAHFPKLVQGRIKRTFAFCMIIFYYAVVQFTWLFFGTHSPYWLPYKNFLFSSF